MVTESATLTFNQTSQENCVFSYFAVAVTDCMCHSFFCIGSAYLDENYIHARTIFFLYSPETMCNIRPMLSPASSAAQLLPIIQLVKRSPYKSSSSVIFKPTRDVSTYCLKIWICQLLLSCIVRRPKPKKSQTMKI